MSLSAGFLRLADMVFRIGHFGDFNELMLGGALSVVKIRLARAGVPHRSDGVQAALNTLA